MIAYTENPLYRKNLIVCNMVRSGKEVLNNKIMRTSGQDHGKPDKQIRFETTWNKGGR